jgi:hypothetical protein
MAILFGEWLSHWLALVDEKEASSSPTIKFAGPKIQDRPFLTDPPLGASQD